MSLGGAASCVTTFATAGEHFITAAYSGDATHPGSTISDAVAVTRAGSGQAVRDHRRLLLFGDGHPPDLHRVRGRRGRPWRVLRATATIRELISVPLSEL